MHKYLNSETCDSVDQTKMSLKRNSKDYEACSALFQHLACCLEKRQCK